MNSQVDTALWSSLSRVHASEASRGSYDLFVCYPSSPIVRSNASSLGARCLYFENNGMMDALTLLCEDMSYFEMTW